MGEQQQEEEGCHLAQGLFSYSVQVVLGFAALSSLCYKRVIEKPRRPLLIWFYDVSKQCAGSVFVHLWNMGISIWIAYLRRATRGAQGAADECSLYFFNFTIDILIGTSLIYLMLLVQRRMSQRFDWRCLRSGEYGDPPRLGYFLAQLAAYIIILIMVKTILAFFVVWLDDPIEAAANFLFAPLQRDPNAELVIVMLVCPWILNSLQYWIMDNILMHREEDDKSYQRL